MIKWCLQTLIEVIILNLRMKILLKLKYFDVGLHSVALPFGHSVGSVWSSDYFSFIIQYNIQYQVDMMMYTKVLHCCESLDAT